jgi:hypothetical protein
VGRALQPRCSAEQGPGADCLQRPLRSRFRQQLRRGVRCMLSGLGVQVPHPGFRGAEGPGKRQGVTVRWGLKEAWNKGGGRGTRTGYEVWYARDEWARNHQVLHPQWGVLYKSGVSAQKV